MFERFSMSKISGLPEPQNHTVFFKSVTILNYSGARHNHKNLRTLLQNLHRTAENDF